MSLQETGFSGALSGSKYRLGLGVCVWMQFSEQLSNVPAGAEDKRVTRQPGAARSSQAVCHTPGQARPAAGTGHPLGALARSGHACWSPKQHCTKTCFHLVPSKLRPTACAVGSPSLPGCSLHPSSADSRLWHQRMLEFDSSSN